MAYVAQQAWIQNTTLEKNILFNQPKVDDLYEACLRSCALQSDLAILPGGDQTEIGEKVNDYIYLMSPFYIFFIHVISICPINEALNVRFIV